MVSTGRQDSECAPQLLSRLLAASYALPVEETLRDIADEVASWDAEGLTAKEIDRRILAWGKEHEFDFDTWADELERDMPQLRQAYPDVNLVQLWRAFGFEKWLIECVRSLAFTDEPIPFMSFASGFWLPVPDEEWPVLVAYMTPLTDPDLAAKQLKEQYERHFGKKAARKTKAQEVENARMLARHRQNMSYTEIAIQNLRDEHEDITKRPSKYKAKLKTERERVIKAIRAAEEVWKERKAIPSTDE